MFVALPEAVGGSARSLLTVLDELDRRCRRVVVAPQDSWFLDCVQQGELAEEVVPIAGIGHARHERPRAALTVARVAWNHRRDLAAIHANGLAELNLAAVAGRMSGARVVVWCHDYQVTPWARRLTPVLAAVGRATLVPVSGASARLLAEAGIRGPRVTSAVHNPLGSETVDAGSSRPRNRVVTVGYLGSPERYKGFDLLPTIASALDPGVRLRVFADPTRGDASTWLALHEAPNVDVVGVVDDVRECYRSIDLVLCPSRQESFGRVAAEAMASGVPVVASALPALREVLADAGTFFDVGDPVGAADAIRAVRARC